eukprot:9850809-Lingulodinium_polyedra.AAC.1
MPGVLSGQSGATDLQMSPAFPFDYALPPRTSACGRTNAKDYGLLVALDVRRVLANFEIRKNPTGHL